MFTPDLDIFPKERVAMVLYGAAGTGKSTLIYSLLQDPSLKIIVFALEPTVNAAMRNCFKVFGIEQLNEGQLTWVVPDIAIAKDAEELKNNLDTSFYDNIIKRLFDTEGIDVATGKKVRLGKFSSYGSDTVLGFDGVSALVGAMPAVGMKKAITRRTSDNAMSVFGYGMEAVVNLFNQLTKGTKAHVIVMAHQKLADEKAIGKYLNIKPINPDFYTRSLVDQICGMFTYVFYVKRNSMNNRFCLSLAEPNAYTRGAINKNILEDKVKDSNKILKPYERIDMSNLPFDLLHDVYDFFK